MPLATTSFLCKRVKPFFQGGACVGERGPGAIDAGEHEGAFQRGHDDIGNPARVGGAANLACGDGIGGDFRE